MDPHKTDRTSDNPVILFDGVCNLCNSSVDWLIRHDKQRRYRYASLQSEWGQAQLSQQNMPTEALSTILLVENGVVYDRSTAVLRVLKRLSAPWSWMGIFLLVPLPLRDMVYGFIARNRYRWFGRRDTCRVPTPEERALFI